MLFFHFFLPYLNIITIVYFDTSCEITFINKALPFDHIFHQKLSVLLTLLKIREIKASNISLLNLQLFLNF